MRAILMLVSALLLASLTPATANHCSTWTTATTNAATGTVVVNVNDVWLAIDASGGGSGLFENTNGEPGLQRVSDTCHGLIAADQPFSL